MSSMYILAVAGKEMEGAYAVDENDKRKVYMFLDKDDAVRYAGLLEADMDMNTLSSLLMI